MPRPEEPHGPDQAPLPDRGSADRSADVMGAAGLAFLTVLGMALRLEPLAAFHVNHDGTYPWAYALRLARDGTLPWAGPGHGFHFGYLQYWLLAPVMAVVPTLSLAMAANAIFHGLIAVPVGLAARSVGGWGAALVAAALVATVPVLVVYPYHGAYTYQAPVWVGLAAWAGAAAVSGPGPAPARALPVVLAGAILVHPYAGVVAVGSLVLVPRLLKAHGWRPLVGGTLVAALTLAPMVADNVRLVGHADSGGPDLARLVPVDQALTSPGGTLVRALVWGAFDREGMLQAVGTVFRTGGVRAWQGVTLLVVPALVVLALTRRTGGTRGWRAGRLILWWCLASHGVLALAVAMRPYFMVYHYALLIPLNAVVAGWAAAEAHRGLTARLDERARVGWDLAAVALLAAGVAAAAAFTRVRPVQDSLQGFHVGLVERAASAVVQDAGEAPRTVAVLGDAKAGHASSALAYVVQQRLQGVPEALCQPRSLSGEAVRAYVVAEIRDALWEAWEAEAGGTGVPWPREVLVRSTVPGITLRVLAFPDVREGTRWLRRGCDLPGAASWLLVDNPYTERAMNPQPGMAPPLELAEWAMACDEQGSPPSPLDGP